MDKTSENEAITRAYERYARTTNAARTAYFLVLRAAYKSYMAEVHRTTK